VQSTPPVRVLIVDDSAVQRQMLARLLASDPSVELVGSASNGAEALRAVARLRPDVITLDEGMPIMSGLEAARHIMRETPTPIVMISGATGQDARQLADNALAAGVVAVRGKQALADAEPTAVADLVRLLKSMASVRVVRRRREPVVRDGWASGAAPGGTSPTTPELVAIGASTGGPQTLRDIISRLPATFPLPVLVVQHTTAGYADTLVDWLGGAARLPVRVADDGDALDRPGVYIAPTRRHMLVQGRQVVLSDAQPVSLHRPSATVLFRSVAASYGSRAIGVLLTGMGDDGAAGLMAMKQAGALTIAQDEASSIVFGMPAEAIRIGAADYILPPEGIARLVLQQLERKEAAA
jgi:two-component system, chemotaxis family, protein-glutamate methylesterase/glutaminase